MVPLFYQITRTCQDSIFVTVGVAGYGTIGQRLADGIALQEDMELAGIADLAPTLSLQALRENDMIGANGVEYKLYLVEGADPAAVVFDTIAAAKARDCDVIICDTAGRLHIDEELMQELQDIKNEVHPNEILLVIDAMTGQDAVNVAEKFNETLGIDGVILTKLDGDTRGGAAL